jgi:leucyl/phenylalanyl-tRNA--protein transferase
VAIGGDLEPGTLLAAYRAGLFPMPVGRRHRIGWWSPDPRAILPVDGMHVSRSLRRRIGRFTVTVDVAFEQVMRGCADPRRPHGWITGDFISAYVQLHELGWAHSVEVWSDGELAGGVYGVGIGAFFAGESMFHRVTDASKVALVALTDLLARSPGSVIDVQWLTPHLASLGAIEIPRTDYLDLIRSAMSVPVEPFA